MKTGLPCLEPPKSLSERVFEVLSDAITEGDFEPGKPLIAVEVAEQLGVSRTPVRVAMGQLEQLGLLTPTEGQRYIIPPLSLDDLKSLYAVRELLEGLAARLAASRISNAQFSELERCLEETHSLIESTGTLNDYQHPEGFHRIILEAAADLQLTRSLQQISLHIRRYRSMALTKLDPSSLRTSVREHRAIFDAIAANDEQLAEQRMREHVVHAQERLISDWKC